MPSLRQLLALHPSLLILDASSPRVEVSLWRGPSPSPLVSETVEGEASVAMPRAVSRVLAAEGEGRRIQDLDAIAYCDGPGSVLGIRLSAASVRAWRAVCPDLASYAFHSLSLLALSHPGLTIVADARRDSWHAARAGAPHELIRLPSADLAHTGPLGTPDNFRLWSALPAGITPQPLPYSAAHLLAAAPDEPFLRPSPAPDAWMAESPDYVTWTPRIHQAPTAP